MERGRYFTPKLSKSVLNAYKRFSLWMQIKLQTILFILFDRIIFRRGEEEWSKKPPHTHKIVTAIILQKCTWKILDDLNWNVWRFSYPDIFRTHSCTNNKKKNNEKKSSDGRTAAWSKRIIKKCHLDNVSCIHTHTLSGFQANRVVHNY